MTSISNDYLETGFVKIKLDELAFKKMHEKFLAFVKGISSISDFDLAHNNLNQSNLNDVRLQCYDWLSENNFKELMYEGAKEQIHEIVGNELAVQIKPNLNIQLPNDISSLIPIHTDVWCGNSPFEVVCWMPFVDCWSDKSVYILPLKQTNEILNDKEFLANASTTELFDRCKNDLIWPEVKKGEALLFSHHLIHGNVVNTQETTRWSINQRFKSLLSPYAEKGLGDYFVPLNVRPQTLIGKEIYAKML